MNFIFQNCNSGSSVASFMGRCPGSQTEYFEERQMKVHVCKAVGRGRETQGMVWCPRASHTGAGAATDPGENLGRGEEAPDRSCARREPGPVP